MGRQRNFTFKCKIDNVVVWCGVWWAVVGDGCDGLWWPRCDQVRLIINDETHQQPEQFLRGSNCLYQRSDSAIISVVNILRWDRWPSYLDVEVCYFPGIFPQHLSQLSQSLKLCWSCRGVGNPGLVSPGSQEGLDCHRDQRVTARVTENNTAVRASVHLRGCGGGGCMYLIARKAM